MRNRNFKDVFKKSLLLLAIVFSASTLKAQLTGVKTIPGDYATISAFVTDANSVGIGAGGVVVNVAAGHIETSTAIIALTATGTAANPILIQKFGAGANPMITSYTGGVGTPGTAIQDGVFALVGSDYVTIDGIDLAENAANSSNPSTMEYGYGMFKASATDGCQFNVIRNCTVSLSNINNAAGSGPSFDGSRGINVTNALISAQTTSVTVTAASGSHSNNQFYTNSIQNVNIGIALAGFAAATPFTLGDTGNDVGGASLLTGNTIINFGGAAAATNPAAGIRTVNQWSPNISYNTINNNTGAGVNHVSTLRAVFIGAATSANTTVNNNIITLQSGATTSLLEGISNAAGGTAASNTININNNALFVAYSTATSGSINTIVNTATATTVNINGNTITNIAALPVLQNVIAGTGTVVFIAGGSPTNLNVNTNTISTFARTSFTGGTTRGIVFTSPANTTISGNTIENIAYSAPTSIGNIDGIFGTSSSVNVSITNNIVRNLSTPTTGTITGIREWGIAGTKIITGNQVYGFATTSGGAGGASFNGIFTSTGTVTVQNNTIYNLVSTGSSGGTGGTVYGYQSSGSTATTVLANKIYDLASNSTNPVVAGLHITAGTTNTITNNIIGDLRAPFANAANAVVGINVTGGTTANVYYNTVRLTAASSGTNFGSSAISTATSTNLTMNNNIFVNSSSANGTGLAVAYRRSSTTLTSYQASSDRNDFIASTIYTDGTTPLATLAAYQTAMATRDANSISEVPNFISTTGSNATFLHINTALPSGIESGGGNIGGITTDFDTDIRQGNGGYAGTGTAPDMGADEFETSVVNCSAANGGTISPSTNTNCEGTTRTITSAGVSNEFGNAYQWKVSTTAGGPYVNVTGGTGATTASYTTATLTPGTYYYVLETTCSFGSLTGLSNEYTLVVNPTPLVLVTPSSATYCNPGTAVSLTASGASSYAWSPATGLSAITGATVNASPSVTTTYTVLGSDLGCPSLPVNVTITVANAPVISSITATPTAVCNTGDSQLNSTSTVSYNQSPSAYGFAASAGTYSTITGTPAALVNGDDTGEGNLPIGFTFNYNGAAHTVFSVNSNGYLVLSQTTNTNTFTNNLTSVANVIAPLWDDNNATGGSVVYSTTGVTPNQVLTVQWTALHIGGGGSATNPTMDMQIRLYESSGVVEIVYGATSAALAGTTASIGISGAVGNYLSVTPLLPVNTSTVSSTVQNSTISSATNFPSGTIYTFTPPVAPVITYSWSPATFLNSTTITNPLATGLNATTTYTLSALANGCTTTANVTVTANPLPTAPTATNSAQCGAQIPTASVASTSGLPTPTFVWYDAAVAGTVMQSSTSTTFTSVVSTTTTFYVSELNTVTGCESALTPVTITVATADLIQASIDLPTICIGQSVNLSVVNLNPTPLQSYSYTWSSTAGNGLVTTTGAAVVATPTIPGSYTFNVNGVDGGCNAVSSVNLTVAPFTATLAAINVTCFNAGDGSFSLTSSSCGTAPFTYSVDGGAFGAIPTNLTPGTYSVVTMDNNGYTVAPQSIVITQPSQVALANVIGTTAVCQNASSALITAGPSTGTFTGTFGTNVAIAGSSTTNYTVTPTLPAGAVVTSTTLRFSNVSTFAGEWPSDMFVSLTGGSTLASITMAPVNVGVTNAGPYDRVASNYTSGPVNLQIFNSYTGTATLGSVTLIIAYTIPNPPTTNFYSASTGGTFLGSGLPFETVGTSVLPNTNTPGVYNFYAEGANGSCVSASRTLVTVTVKANSTSTTPITACNSYTWTNGTTYTASGTYTQVLTNAVGCDSTATLNLTINNSTTSSTPITACNTYTWTNGMTYTASGTYTQVLTNAVGCDSTATLNLTINNSTTSSTPVTACDSYTWTNGATYTLSGTYTQVLTNAVGCDSTATLVLTINNSTTSSTSITACDTYTWTNGTTYTMGGTYSQVLTNAAGCDSTATLILTINNSSNSSIVITACDSYTWTNGTTYTVSGTYIQVLTNAVGCDSTDVLVLTINNSSSSSTSIAACNSYTWTNGTTYTVSGTYTQVLTNAVGCDSTATLVLTINNSSTGTDVITACDSYTWINGVTYTANNSIATFMLTNAAGCDSLVTLNLTITSSPTAVATDNGDATITSSTGTSYQWIDCGTGLPISGATSQTYAATSNGSYAVILYNGACDDTSSCVVIDYIGIKEITQDNISVFPNPTRDFVTVNMTAANATIEVVDAHGKILQTSIVENGGTLSLASYETGMYIFRITTENGTSIHRISKN